MTEAVYDSILLSSLDRMYRAEYAAADSMLGAIPAQAPARAYFHGLILFNRFNDLGDTAALREAAAAWETVRKLAEDGVAGSLPDSGNLSLYEGLAILQLSYVAELEGRSLGAASLGRQAAAKLRPLAGAAEADAALALYDYYKAALLKGISWLPFVNPDIDGPMHRLEQAAPRSRYLREVLQTSLIWLYYDGGRFDQGLALVDGFLARYPANRLGRQIKADFLFRKKQFAGARDIQEGLKAEYEHSAGLDPAGNRLPTGYLSAVGNLAKVYSALGQAELRKKHLAIWSAPRHKEVLPWLPGSLRREVKGLPK